MLETESRNRGNGMRMDGVEWSGVEGVETIDAEQNNTELKQTLNLHKIVPP